MQIQIDELKIENSQLQSQNHIQEVTSELDASKIILLLQVFTISKFCPNKFTVTVYNMKRLQKHLTFFYPGEEKRAFLTPFRFFLDKIILQKWGTFCMLLHVISSVARGEWEGL